MKSDWTMTSLGQVCTVQSGAGFPTKYQGKVEGEFPFFKVSDMNLEGNEDELVTANNYIDEKVRVILSARCFPTGSVLFPKVGGAIATNKKRKVVRPSCADNNVMGLIPDASALDENYLFHWMKAQDLYEFSNKANPPSITQSAVRDWPISVPPLEEQKRIVAVLDQALAALDRARAHAEANLADAVELFDRYLSHEMSGIRRASGIPNSSGADIRLMKDIVTFHNGDRGKNYPNKSEYVVAGIPWINTGHIMEDGSLSEEKMNFISEAKFKQLGGGKTEVGDLVFCLRGATIGKTAFVGPYSPGAVASSLMIIRPGKEIVDKYAYYFLTSELGKSEIRRFIGGAAQPNLAGKSVGEFNVPLPSIEEQKRIVERIGAVQRNVEKSKRRYQQKLGDLANLRQSLLQKAFSGELT